MIKKYKKRLLVFALVFSSVISFSFVEDYFEISKNLDIFATLFREINLYYVDETKPGELMKKGIDAMLQELDPYTEYYPESELEDYKMKYISSQYGGVGALVFQKDDKILVSEPYENFPAQKADIRAGDEIVEIDGRTLKGKDVSEISDMLKGQAGTAVKIKLRRIGVAEMIEKSLVREEIKMNNVPYYGMLNDSVGYIKLDKFLENSYKEVKDAFVDLRTKNNLKSLVLDLRGNGGGILQESVQIVNLFVDKGTPIVNQKARIKEMNFDYKGAVPATDNRLPIAVLIDGGSASASEITCGAIQDLDRGVLIGQRSFGKGLVQQTRPLSYNAQLKVTIAKYFIPSGRCVQALNYKNRSADNGSAMHVPDSLITEFKTKNGRLVYDGSGVYPDIKTELPKYSNIARSLASKSHIFDYATQYRNTHDSIAKPKDFHLTDKDYQDFIKFLSDKEYDYITKSEKKLDELQKTAEKEKYYEDIKQEFESLRKKMIHNKNDDLVKFKTEITLLLENEIVSRYYFQTGRLEWSFKTDSEVQSALKTLGNRALYASILKGEGAYKQIGKPGTEKKDPLVIDEEDEEK